MAPNQQSQQRRPPFTDHQGKSSHLSELAMDSDQSCSEQPLVESIAYHLPGSIYRVIFHADGTKSQPYVNYGIEVLTGVRYEDAIADPTLLPLTVHPDDRDQFECWVRDARETLEPFDHEFRLITTSGEIRWVRDCAHYYRLDNGDVVADGMVLDISSQKITEQALCYQIHQEQMLENVASHIRHSLDLRIILQTTVQEVRQFLQADRVLIYRFTAKMACGRVVVEDCAPDYPSLLGWEIGDACEAVSRYIQPFMSGELRAIANVQDANLPVPYRQLLETFQVRSQLVIPIFNTNYDPAQPATFKLTAGEAVPGDGASDEIANSEVDDDYQHLWGLLVVQQCARERYWQCWEMQALKRLETQLAVAIQQAALYNRLQQVSESLEIEIRERTMRLQQALGFEAVLKRITERIRDSLDETTILQAAVEELATLFNAISCNACLYDLERQTATIAYESTQLTASVEGNVVQMAQWPEFYEPLLQAQVLQVCLLRQNPAQGRNAVLICPIVTDEEVMGDLWLIHHADYVFNSQEVQLVQQVASQCAIALRQSQLYYAAKQQVDELARLNRLKDDFLSTISHELRTPLSSIKMSVQLLEMLLPDCQDTNQDGSRPSKIGGCLQILKQECDREISLINDLLTLQHLEAGTQPFIPSDMRLQDWIPEVVETFEDRCQDHHQTLQVNIPAELPPITTDLYMFNRIFGELLTNAYKFTPARETITVTVHQISHSVPTVQVSVTNTGVTIPDYELEHVFNKFYRISSQDPWKHGGTGLGLALAKNMAIYLGGSLTVSSGENDVRFTLELPVVRE